MLRESAIFHIRSIFHYSRSELFHSRKRIPAAEVVAATACLIFDKRYNTAQHREREIYGEQETVSSDSRQTECGQVHAFNTLAESV